MRFPSMVVIFAGIINVLLVIWLSHNTDWGMYGVAAANAVILTITNALFNPWYSSRLINVSNVTFLIPMLPGCFAMTCIIGLAWAVSICVDLSMPIVLIISGGTISIVYFLIICVFGLK